MNKRFILVLFTLLSFNLFAQNKEQIIDILNQNEQIYKQLEDDFKSIQSLVDVLKSANSNIQLNANSIKSISDNAIIRINNLEENIEHFKSALISNNEDLGTVINELGELSVELSEYKAYVNSLKLRMTRNEIIVNTIIPITTLPLVGFGVYDILNDNKVKGNFELYSGIGLFVGAELIYNGGHFILKLW